MVCSLHLVFEHTVAQHVKRLRQQIEALGGARVAVAARVMLHREPPVPDADKTQHTIREKKRVLYRRKPLPFTLSIYTYSKKYLENKQT